MKRLAVVFAVVVAAVFLFVPPVHQSETYHAFADQRTLFGVPNFWNVVTNLPFLAVAIWGVRAFRSKASFREPWERTAYAIVLAGGALVAFGSGWYHWHPTNATLVWDRLPMTLVFTAVFAMIADERGLLAPAVGIGVASIVVWVVTGDLRLYGIVQFLPMLVIPALLLFAKARYSGVGWLWAMCGFYALAKILELGDAWIAQFVETGGHPWKHAAAALALFTYSQWVARRRPMRFD